jgi:hypothetical protein
MDRSRAHPAPPRNSGCPRERSIRKNQAFQNQQISVQGAKGQLILFPIERKTT